MVFSSIVFLFRFLPLFFVLYYLVPGRMKNVLLFFGSLIFYAWGEPVYVLLMLFSTIVDYTHGRLLERFRGKRRAGCILLSSVVINLALLCFFKYADFLIRTINTLSGSEFPLLNLPLPIGISFYTFQTMSYTIDVYRGEAKVQKNLLDFGVYVTMFPQLIAGPIVKYRDVEAGIHERSITLSGVSDGMKRFCIGLGKKVLLANQIGALWVLVSGRNLREISTLTAWAGIVAFAFQIYFDFSGYSDMAIGLGEMLGFHFPDNFNYPYISASVTEFWRRWHISLSSWLRDYVYIPLGGNRKGTFRTYLNNFLTMLIGGLWHGAAWKFVFWGAMHGAGLAVHKACKPVLARIPDNWLTIFLFWAITFIYVSLLWVFFRAASFEDSVLIIKNIFVDFQWTQFPQFFEARMIWCVMMLVLIVMHFVPQKWADAVGWLFVKLPWLLKLVLFVAVVQLVIEFMSEEVAPFIYFQF